MSSDPQKDVYFRLGELSAKIDGATGHINIINSEMGQIRDELVKIRVDMAKNSGEVAGILKFLKTAFLVVPPVAVFAGWFLSYLHL